MIVDGVELLRLIRDGEIEENISIKELNNDLIITLKNNVLYYYNVRTEEECELFEDYDLSILKCKFKIELKNKILKQEEKEEEEIDIQSIKELDPCAMVPDAINGTKLYYSVQEGLIIKQQNRIIKALKQLDRKIKE